MTDPQNDVPCRDCGQPTQAETERCAECSTPAGRLVTALAARGVKATARRGNVYVNGHTFAATPVCDGGEVWEITDVAETFDEGLAVQADAIAAIVKATTPDPFAGFRDHLQSKAIKDHAALLSDHAHLVTQSDGAMDALRPHTSHANICRAAEDVVGRMVAAEAERDTLAASVAALEAHNGRMVAALEAVADRCDAAEKMGDEALYGGEVWDDAISDVVDALPSGVDSSWAALAAALRDLAGGAS